MKLPSFILISAALALPCFSARAADDATCDRYAAEAVSQAAQNAARACGYSGPAWGTDPVRDYNGHLNWCLAANNASVEKEANARRVAINLCSVCLDYAQQAVDAFTSQDKLFCGNPSGPRWSANKDGHLKWCLVWGRDSTALARETSARSMLLGRCEVCDAYAKDAMRQRQAASDLKCGFEGARWSSHAGGHKSWCMEQGGRAIGYVSSTTGQEAWRVEKQARDAELNECKQCRDYAKTAAAQARKARLCFRLSGPQWSTNETTHFNSCMAMEDGSRESETTAQADARAKTVGECTVGVTTRPLDPANTRRSGAGSSSGESGALQGARRVRTDPKTGRAASSGNSALPGNRAKTLSPGLLEGDAGLGQRGPSAIGSPLGGGTGASPAGGGLR